MLPPGCVKQFQGQAKAALLLTLAMMAPGSHPRPFIFTTHSSLIQAHLNTLVLLGVVTQTCHISIQED